MERTSLNNEQQHNNNEEEKKENEMRVIFFEELLTDDNFSNLTKAETDRLLKIVATFARENKEELKLSFLKCSFDISDEFIKKTSFCLNYGTTVSIKKYFKWFGSNKDYVAKSRRRKNTQEVILEEIINEGVPAEKKESIDYDKIKDIFNECFKGTKVPAVRILTDARKRAIKSLYIKMSKHLTEKVDIYEFYEGYFELIKDEGDKKCNLVKGWMNTNSNSWFQPDLDYYLKEKTFTKLTEKV